MLLDGHLSRIEGAGLVALYGALVGVVWRRERQPPAIGELAETADDDASDDRHGGQAAAVGLALAVGGIAVMAAGGAFAVQGAERVVAALSVTDTAVGLTGGAGHHRRAARAGLGRGPA